MRRDYLDTVISAIAFFDNVMLLESRHLATRAEPTCL